MKLPPARGVLTDWLTKVLRGSDSGAVPSWIPQDGQPMWADLDAQLALWCCYELSYRGFDDIDWSMQWSPDVLALRASLDADWEACLRELCAADADDGDDVAVALRRVVDDCPGVGLSDYLSTQATRPQFAEFLVHRSVYQLKEADPHSMGIARLEGRAKAALVEIEADEYGGGRLERMHSELFRTTMRAFELDASYGAYVSAVPAQTLAISNVMSLFAVHRRLIGALVGHLAALEMSSTAPNRRYSSGARRLGADGAARRYFDEHVEADAVHEQIAAHDLCGSFVAEQPDRFDDVLFGARAALVVDDLAAASMLGRWRQGTTSLLESSGLMALSR